MNASICIAFNIDQNGIALKRFHETIFTSKGMNKKI